MRPGQNKRMRGRPNNSNNSGGHRKGPNPLTRSYESNGPDVKIRGNAHHVAEKYLQLARDAQSSGDPVAAESYLQHAEHYFRLIASAQQAQAGYSRQPDAVDTEGEDDDEGGIPDRFASPQAPAPFVPQAPAQPYASERQPYNGDRQPYADRPANGAGGGQPYADRPNAQGDRPSYGERNNDFRSQRQDRQDRNGMNRRPYRDNAERSGEVRADDRAGPDRGQQERGGQDRPFGERNNQYRRNGQDRQYDRSDRSQGGPGERPYREPQAELPRDPYSGEQPRVDAMEGEPDRVAAGARQEPMARADAVPQGDAPAAKAEAVPRATPSEDAPGLPSFITTPTRVAVDPPSVPEPSLATATSFPGDGTEDAPKFPRRRRRIPRAVTAEPIEAGEQPASGD